MSIKYSAIAFDFIGFIQFIQYIQFVNMAYIFWGDHPFKLRVGVFGKFFFGVCGDGGYLRSPTQDRGGGVVKIFRGALSIKKRANPRKYTKIPQKSRLVYIMPIMRHKNR